MKIKSIYITEYNTECSIDIDIEFGKYLKKEDVISIFDMEEERESITFADSDSFYHLLVPKDKPERVHYEYVVYERVIHPQGTDGVNIELKVIDRCYSDSDEDGVLDLYGICN